MNKYFIITVDTEGDNLWNYKKGDQISTNNSLYIPRFQDLCERYDFPPVYLTNYEMLCDDYYVSFIKQKHLNKLCEVGLHLHAWNNPPEYELESMFTGNPYLIEYPDEVMRAKFDYIYKLFCDRMGFKPISHRAGRWAMDKRYFKLLEDYDVLVDCSYTPLINWESNKGSTRGGTDYSRCNNECHFVGHTFEVPLTVVNSRKPMGPSIRQNLRAVFLGKNLQLRPAIYSLHEMKYIVDKLYKSTTGDYIQFMLHSSELMPGGSPYFKDAGSIESLYSTLDVLFEYIHSKGFIGITLKEYYEQKK